VRLLGHGRSRWRRIVHGLGKGRRTLPGLGSVGAVRAHARLRSALGAGVEQALAHCQREGGTYPEQQEAGPDVRLGIPASAPRLGGAPRALGGSVHPRLWMLDMTGVWRRTEGQEGHELGAPPEEGNPCYGIGWEVGSRGCGCESGRHFAQGAKGGARWVRLAGSRYNKVS
jgi:hypothetical protein